MHRMKRDKSTAKQIRNWIESQGINYDLASEDQIRADVDAARDFLLEVAEDTINFRRYPEMNRVCLMLWRASVTLGFRRGIEQGWKAVGIGKYFEKYPERKCIAERLREKPNSSDNELCRHLDRQEERLVSGYPNIRERWYPLPWGRRNPKAKQSHLEWEAALNEPKLSNRLHKFFSSQRKLAKSSAAQWYWAWHEFKNGKSIRPRVPFPGYSFFDLRTGQFLDPETHLKRSPLTPEELDSYF